MGEQTRIVVKDFPVERLPEELRRGLEAGHRVRVTVEDESDVSAGEPRYKRFHGMAADRNTSIEEAVARVRALRDEWD